MCVSSVKQAKVKPPYNPPIPKECDGIVSTNR